VATVYKLTDQHLRTMQACQWEVGQWKIAGDDPGSIGGWLHCYFNPRLAILLNPVHAHIEKPRLWLAEARGRMVEQHRTKWAFSRMRLVKELPIPEMTAAEKLLFAKRCKEEVCDGCWCKPSYYLGEAIKAVCGGGLDYFVAESVQCAAKWKAIDLVGIANGVWNATNMECSHRW
jgi:hypothetical protein